MNAWSEAARFRNGCRRPQRERERVCGHVLVSGSLCHARTDEEEEEEVWEAEMDDGFQTI